jgi:cytochrome oxidase Cu insertion factor (SCO1/SenC/PrrC family)
MVGFLFSRVGDERPYYFIVSNQENIMTSTEYKATNNLLTVLMIIIVLLMLAISGLFIRMNQLQALIVDGLSASQSKEPVGLAIGSAAPEFTLVDTQGKKVSLKDFTGRKVMLGFFSISCSVCQETYPVIKAFSESRDDIQVVLISKAYYHEVKSFPVGQ